MSRPIYYCHHTTIGAAMMILETGAIVPRYAMHYSGFSGPFFASNIHDVINDMHDGSYNGVHMQIAYTPEEAADYASRSTPHWPVSFIFSIDLSNSEYEWHINLSHNRGYPFPDKRTIRHEYPFKFPPAPVNGEEYEIVFHSMVPISAAVGYVARYDLKRDLIARFLPEFPKGYVSMPSRYTSFGNTKDMSLRQKFIASSKKIEDNDSTNDIPETLKKILGVRLVPCIEARLRKAFLKYTAGKVADLPKDTILVTYNVSGNHSPEMERAIMGAKFAFVQNANVDDWGSCGYPYVVKEGRKIIFSTEPFISVEEVAFSSQGADSEDCVSEEDEDAPMNGETGDGESQSSGLVEAKVIEDGTDDPKHASTDRTMLIAKTKGCLLVNAEVEPQRPDNIEGVFQFEEMCAFTIPMHHKILYGGTFDIAPIDRWFQIIREAGLGNYMRHNSVTSFGGDDPDKIYAYGAFNQTNLRRTSLLVGGSDHLPFALYMVPDS